MNTTVSNQTATVEQAPWSRVDVLTELARLAYDLPAPTQIRLAGQAPVVTLLLEFDHVDDIPLWADAIGTTLLPDRGQPHPLRYDTEPEEWISIVDAKERWNGWRVEFRADRQPTAELIASWVDSGQRARFLPVATS